MKLDLGCGSRRRDGFIGVDSLPSAATQVVADITKLPFRKGSVEEFMLDNVVEHVDDLLALIREVTRVARDGARVVIVTPHFSSWASWRDPTHVRHLSYFAMDHLAQRWPAAALDGRLQVVRRQLSFGGGPGLIGRALFAASPQAYEKYWCFVFRASTLRFELRIDKGTGRAAQ